MTELILGELSLYEKFEGWDLAQDQNLVEHGQLKGIVHPKIKILSSLLTFMSLHNYMNFSSSTAEHKIIV